jgi:chromosome segregation ATPase
MARRGITYEQVVKAVKAISARGEEPTIGKIRAQCDDAGSFTTISSHLKRWRAEETESANDRDLPQEVENELFAVVRQVWAVATKAADADINAIKQEAEDERTRMRERIKEGEEEIGRLEGALEKAEAEAERLSKHAATLEKQLAETAGELQTAQRLYRELLATLKPQAAEQAPRAAGTKPARPPKTMLSPENTPGETH